MSNAEVAFITTATLLMRPFGALLFGLWADHIGRRVPLMVDVAFYSVPANAIVIVYYGA